MGNIILCSNSECKKASYCYRHMAVTVSPKKYDDFRARGCKEPTYYDFIHPEEKPALSLVAVESIWKEIRGKEFKRK